MKLSLVNLCLVMLFVAAVAGCTAAAVEPQKSAVPGFPMTVTDGIDRQVRLEKMPEKIVSLAPSNTEILYALGLGEKVVGVTQYCNFPEEVKAKPKVGGFSTADIERIVALTPDLALVSRIHEKEVIPALERVGVRAYGLSPKTVDAIPPSISGVGVITGRSQAASNLVEIMASAMSGVTSRTNGLGTDRRPRVLYVNWHDPIKSAGRDTFADDLIRKAGGTNIVNEFTGYNAVSLESIVTRNPQVIIVSGMGTTRQTIYNSIMAESRLKGTEAMAKGQVYEIDSDLIDRPGPRIVQALAQIAKLIHPEIFGKL